MQEAYRNCDERLVLNLPLPGPRFEGVATSEELAFNVTVALWSAKLDAAWTEIMVENFKVDQSCDVATDSAELPPQVSLEDVSGVFYILAAFVVYRRAYAEHDTWRAKVAGVAVEAGCFVALLGITIEFYATCWRALPNRGQRMVFPGEPEDDKVQEVWVNVASVGICLAGLMSLVMSYLHFRTPCWNSELPEYGRD